MPGGCKSVVRNETGFKGVYCTARIRVNNQVHHLGCFNNPDDAREAYVRECERLFREPVGKGYRIFAGINLPGSRFVNLGSFETMEEAAEAYDQAAIKHFGDKAVTNRSLGLL